MRGLKQALSSKGSNWAICLLSASLLAVAASVWLRPGPVRAEAGAMPRVHMSQENKQVLNALQDGFVNIADTVEPSVVTVSARAADRPERTPRDRPRPMQDPGDKDKDKEKDVPE